MKSISWQSVLIVELIFSGVTSLVFPVLQASAQCGWLDPTCSPSQWNRPPITFPKPSESSGSCLQVMSYPQQYKWSVRNDKTYLQTFWLDNQKYELEAGRSLYFTSKVGTAASSSCDPGTNYREPVISFDRFANDEKFTKREFRVDVTNHKEFYFWKDGNTIKFSHR